MTQRTPYFKYIPSIGDSEASCVQIGDRTFGTLRGERTFYGHRVADEKGQWGKFKGSPLKFGKLGDLLTFAHGVCLNQPSKEVMDKYLNERGYRLTADPLTASILFGDIFSGRGIIGNTILYRGEECDFVVDNPKNELLGSLDERELVEKLGPRQVGNVRFSEDGLTRMLPREEKSLRGRTILEFREDMLLNYLVLMTGIELAGKMVAEIIGSLNEIYNPNGRPEEKIVSSLLYPQEEIKAGGLIFEDKILRIGVDDAGLSENRFAYGAVRGAEVTS